ncbi:MAG: ABC transporter ATP-binding protein [Verrucomicrobia bacterium]|nr:ABC transporter ATP-binding protein [Verrucomicrobiota bacterium]
MNKQTAISLENVSFGYDKTLILEHVNFSIQSGEFVGIFGPNGGGKTTLLKLLMGFIQPNRGKISLLGRSPKQSRIHIGYVPQATKIDKQFPITTEEVVQMGCLSKTTFFGILPPIFKQKVLDCLEKVHMAHKKDIPFGHLSGGEAQRVLIARALASDPSLLFLDEPTASVDPVAEQEILSILSSLKGSLTILMVTHDLQTILQKVEKLLCVHREVHTLATSEVCEHYGLGLYHSPLIKTFRK